MDGYHPFLDSQKIRHVSEFTGAILSVAAAALGEWNDNPGQETRVHGRWAYAQRGMTTPIKKLQCLLPM